MNVKPAGRVSVMLKPELEDGPLLVTVSWYLPDWPAVTGSKSLPSHSSTLVKARSVLRTTVVSTVLLVSLPGVGSVVPSELTEPLLDSVLPAAAVLASVTWIVNVLLPPTDSPLVVEQVTTWPTTEHSVLEPVTRKVSPAGSVSVTVKPPTWTEGPLLVTTRS